MKLFPLVNHCNKPPPTREFCNYLVKSVFFFTSFAPESHWVCKSGGLYISYQYLFSGGQSHLVLFGEKRQFYFIFSVNMADCRTRERQNHMAWKWKRSASSSWQISEQSCGGETHSHSQFASTSPKIYRQGTMTKTLYLVQGRKGLQVPFTTFGCLWRE